MSRIAIFSAVLCFGFWSANAFAQQATAVGKTITTESKVPHAIFDYVQREEPVYSWRVVAERESDAGRTIVLRMTSQTWHDIVWEHQMVICEPKLVRHPKHAILFVNGGSQHKLDREPRDIGQFMAIATLSGGLVASVYQVPNQPLFDGRYEDDAITETWLRYLQTKDATWPLLFPMAKSAVKAMDTVQTVAKQKFQREIDGFVITGASKRGWTSWLTPVVDSRVKGTAPMVIDTLNFRKQMRHQHDSWGQFSEQIADYTRKNLVKLSDESATEKSLREMMDPWTYRERLTLPKLIVNGSNDPYWCVDAINNYWSDLKGPKHTFQLANAGHGLKNNRQKVVAVVAQFFEHVASGKPMPKLSWSYADDSHTLSVTSDPPARSAQVWLATSPDGDFRNDAFKATSFPLDKDGKGSLTLNLPDDRNSAFFGELTWGIGPAQWSLSTTVWRR